MIFHNTEKLHQNQITNKHHDVLQVLSTSIAFKCKRIPLFDVMCFYSMLHQKAITYAFFLECYKNSFVRKCF